MTEADQRKELEVLITVKTSPLPSMKYGEVVCTAGIDHEGHFIRLFPIDFRGLPYDQQFKKYQWVRLEAVKHTGRDYRKESFRPFLESIRTIGEPISARDNWGHRKRHVLKNVAPSMEALWNQNESDATSLGIVAPAEILDVTISADDREWSPAAANEMRQYSLFADPARNDRLLRKVPYRFRYHFRCADTHCNTHRLSIIDWELTALYWKLIDGGESEDATCRKVKAKFLDEICSSQNEPHFFVGNTLENKKTWLVLGVIYPKREEPKLL